MKEINNKKIDDARTKLINIKQSLEEVVNDSESTQVEYLLVESSIEKINVIIACLDRKLQDDQR